MLAFVIVFHCVPSTLIPSNKRFSNGSTKFRIASGNSSFHACFIAVKKSLVEKYWCPFSHIFLLDVNTHSPWNLSLDQTIVTVALMLMVLNHMCVRLNTVTSAYFIETHCWVLPANTAVE